MDNLRGGSKHLPFPLTPPEDSDLPSLPSSNNDKDDDRPLTSPPPPQPPSFQPPQQLTVLTPKEIENIAAKVTAGEQVFDKKVSKEIANFFPRAEEILNQTGENFVRLRQLIWGYYNIRYYTDSLRKGETLKKWMFFRGEESKLFKKNLKNLTLWTWILLVFC